MQMRPLIVALALLSSASCSDTGRSLLLVDVTKAPSLAATLDSIELTADSHENTVDRDAPVKIGVYLPSSFSGSVHAVVTGSSGGTVIARAETDAVMTPGKTTAVSVVLTTFSATDGATDDRDADGGIDDRDAPRDAQGSDSTGPDACSPDSKRCSGALVQSCNASGSWETLMTCSGLTPVCLTSNPSCVACQPGNSVNCGNCNGGKTTCDGEGNWGACQNEPPPPTVFYRDTDGDHFGDPTAMIQVCATSSVGYVSNGTDCCDREANAYPGSTFKSSSTTRNVCNSFDYNCNGVEDKEFPDYAPYNVPCTSRATQSLCSAGPYYTYPAGPSPQCGQIVSGSLESCMWTGSACVTYMGGSFTSQLERCW